MVALLNLLRQLNVAQLMDSVSNIQEMMAVISRAENLVRISVTLSFEKEDFVFTYEDDKPFSSNVVAKKK